MPPKKAVRQPAKKAAAGPDRCLPARPGFFQRVYDVVAGIPRGRVMTYGQIAAVLGGYYSGRTVGFAMRAAPAERNLPCHRVVNKKGEMTPGGCFGGQENQRKTLRREGVRFLPDGRIDLARSQLDAETAFRIRMEGAAGRK